MVPCRSRHLHRPGYRAAFRMESFPVREKIKLDFRDFRKKDYWDLLAESLFRTAALSSYFCS